MEKSVVGNSANGRCQHQRGDHRDLEHGKATAVGSDHITFLFLLASVAVFLPKVFQRPPNEHGHDGGRSGIDQQDVPPKHERQEPTGHYRRQHVADVGAEAVHRYGETPPVGESPGEGGGGGQVPQGAGNGHDDHGDGEHEQVGRCSQDQESKSCPDHAAGEDGTPTGLHLVYDRPADEIDRSETALADAQHESDFEVGEAHGRLDGGHEYRESLVVEVGDSVAEGEAAQDKVAALPASRWSLYRFRHQFLRQGNRFRILRATGDSKS